MFKISHIISKHRRSTLFVTSNAWIAWEMYCQFAIEDKFPLEVKKIKRYRGN